GQVYGADAPADEDGRAVAPLEAGDDGELARRHRAHARQDDLAAVRVPADDGGHGELLRLDQALRRVRQQDRVRQRAAQHVRDVADLVGPEADAREVDRLAANRQTRARVLED